MNGTKIYILLSTDVLGADHMISSGKWVICDIVQRLYHAGIKKTTSRLLGQNMILRKSYKGAF